MWFLEFSLFCETIELSSWSFEIGNHRYYEGFFSCALSYLLSGNSGIMGNFWAELLTVQYQKFLVVWGIICWAELLVLVPGIPDIMRNYCVELFPDWYREFPALWEIIELRTCPLGSGNSWHYEEWFFICGSRALILCYRRIPGIIRNYLMCGSRTLDR